jgi:glycosyltransferase involved in cell wall biosynthesis
MNSYGKYVLFADADLSYPFSNIGEFKSKIAKGPDLVLGSRFKGHIEKGSMPFLHRYFGTPLLTLLIRMIYGIPTTDCNSGMRMVKKDFYSKLNMRNSGMEWASELLLKTANKKGKYLEVPITFIKDKRQKSSHLSTWSDGWRHLKAIFLLKPQTFAFFMALCLISALLSYPFSFGFTGFFILMFSVLFFSVLTLQFLAFAIEGMPNRISRILNSNYFVPVIVSFFILSIVIVGLLPDSHLGSKILISGIDAVVIIWTFLIETIKTHLVNRLPDKYFK